MLAAQDLLGVVLIHANEGEEAPPWSLTRKHETAHDGEAHRDNRVDYIQKHAAHVECAA